MWGISAYLLDMCMANDWSQGIAEYSRNFAHFERKKIKKTKGWSEDQGGV